MGKSRRRLKSDGHYSNSKQSQTAKTFTKYATNTKRRKIPQKYQFYDFFEVDYEQVGLDQDDPNYESSDEKLNYIRYQKKIDINKYEKCIDGCIKEYFLNGTTKDVLEILSGFDLSKYRTDIIIKVVFSACNGHDSDCELASRLLKELIVDSTYFLEFDQSIVRDAFSHMLHDILDMALDIPHISQLLARFVARAVIDGIIEKDYVESIQSKESAYLVKFKDYYEKLMIASKTTHNLKHCIWGITGSFMKNSELKTELINIAQSFIYRYNTITEIFQFIRDMRVPHYLHIFVFEITRLSIDSNYSKVILNSIYLLHEASRQLIINNTQICIGLQSAYEYYAQDKQISPAILNKLVYLLRNLYYKRIISNQLFNEFLTKGRSRFFSEKR